MFYVDPGENDYGIHEYKLMLESTTGHHSKTIDVFTRQADISWSPYSQSAYVNDFIGSNLSDCLVLIKRTDDFSVVSLRSRILGNAVSGLAPMLSLEIRREAHTNVSCQDWIFPTKLSVTLSGHTDNSVSREFEYHYLYDLNQDRIDYLK